MRGGTMDNKKFNKAYELLHKKDFKKALNEFTKLLEKADDIYTKNKIQTLINICKSKTEKQNDIEEDLYTKAVVLLNNNKSDEAIKILESLLKKDKNNDSLYYTLAIAYLKLEQTEKAKELLAKSIELNGKNKYHALNEPTLSQLAEQLTPQE
jgi:tetratricopeptide (TPR) repeat protein